MQPYTQRGIAVLCLALGCSGVYADEAPDSTLKVAPTAFSQEEPEPIPGWGQGKGKSYWVPLADISGFLLGLNIFDRLALGGKDYDANPSSWSRNLKGSWVYDNDPFDINQFMHPYQGGMHHGFARSAGLNYWEGLAYSNLGSYLWEIMGETTPPAVNDQVMTGVGGSFLGEALFRLSSLTLESGGGSVGRWREWAAAAISPSSGFNRWGYGRRFRGVFRSNDPAVYTRGQIGANITSSLRSNIDLNEVEGAEAIPQSYDRGEAVADFTVAYGLPGKPGYRYTRPFDYFHMQVTAATGNMLENLMVRGLLVGTDYAVGDDFRGLWGLYGTYDYLAPQIFRISSTALAMGTAGQWWLGRTTALQAEVLGGVGYGSGGIFDGPGERNYHQGLTPLALATTRLILNDRMALDFAARAYRITDTASNEEGDERILRTESGVTFRLVGLHGVTIRYVASRRDARYGGEADTNQSVGAVSVSYAYLGHKWFGAVDWRPEAQFVK